MSANYGNILAGNNNDIWSDVFRTALMWYMNKQGSGSGSTPNFYNVPLTPEQKRVEDEKWRVYQAGGSDRMQQVGAIAQQALSQSQSGPSNFTFMSPEMKNQTFGGGIKFPTFDFSKFKTPGANATAPPTQQFAPHSSKGGPGGAIQWKMPTDGESLYGDISRTHYGDVMNNPQTGPGMNGMEMGRDDPRLLGNGGEMTFSDGGQQFQAVSEWWKGFQASHPNWAQMGPKALDAALAAAFGPAGAAASRIIRWIISRGGNGGQPPSGSPQNPVIPPGGTPSNIPTGGL